MKQLIFDIETTGLNPWFGDRITCICAKIDDEWFAMASVLESDILRGFAYFLEEHIIDYDIVITKNGKQFDIPFILGRTVLVGLQDNTFDALIHGLTEKENIDLQEITKRRVSLDDMSRLLCCQKKSGKGEDAIKLFKERKYPELLKYCKQDVLVTEQVYKKWSALKKIHDSQSKE